MAQRGHRKQILSVAFSQDESADSDRISGQDGEGLEHHRRRAHPDVAMAFRRSRECRVRPLRHASRHERARRIAKIWNLANGKSVQSFPGGNRAVTVVAFSPDGARLATANGLTAPVWDLALGKRIAFLSGQSGDVSALAFRPPQGKVLAVGSRDATVVSAIQATSASPIGRMAAPPASTLIATTTTSVNANVRY